MKIEEVEKLRLELGDLDTAITKKYNDLQLNGHPFLDFVV